MTRIIYLKMLKDHHKLLRPYVTRGNRSDPLTHYTGQLSQGILDDSIRPTPHRSRLPLPFSFRKSGRRSFRRPSIDNRHSEGKLSSNVISRWSKFFLPFFFSLHFFPPSLPPSLFLLFPNVWYPNRTTLS